MKKGIILIVLGIVGLVQYVYFQCTPLAYVIDEVITENIAGHSVITEIVYRRDWTLGIVGAIIGALLLVFGIRRLKQEKQRKAINE